MTISKPAKILLFVIGFLAGLFFLWLYFKISPSGQSFFPKCPFHSFTGYHCPGCGSQRAFHDFLNGNIIEGIKHNFLIGIGLLVLLYKLFLIIRSKFYPDKKTNFLLNPKTAWIILLIVILFWICRNIPYEPFTVLAP